MICKKMNKKILSRRLSKRLKITQPEAEKMINRVLNEVMKAVSVCDELYIKGFGKIVKKTYPERSVKRPNVNESYVVGAYSRIHFRVSDHFKHIVNTAKK